MISIYDKISSNPQDSDESSAVNMYDALVAEGHDARLLRFSPANGVNGGHTSPKNAEYSNLGDPIMLLSQNYKRKQILHRHFSTNVRPCLQLP